MIQNKLKKAGYKLGTSDGILGAKTLQALNNFEAKKGLSKSAKDSIYVATMKALNVTC
jgi:peptidoglycan hydrolase-like protein with peptidoglycan-binding domain